MDQTGAPEWIRQGHQSRSDRGTRGDQTGAPESIRQGPRVDQTGAPEWNRQGHQSGSDRDSTVQSMIIGRKIKKTNRTLLCALISYLFSST